VSDCANRQPSSIILNGSAKVQICDEQQLLPSTLRLFLQTPNAQAHRWNKPATCSVPITTKLDLTNHYCLLFDQRILDQQQYDRERERENSRVTKQQVLWLVGVMELL
jgi:hypothetical protein